MEYECVGCGDTGLNSKGGACVPCQRSGRQTLRRNVVAAVEAVFAEYNAIGELPPRLRVEDAIAWAYKPRVEYAAGYRDGQSMGMFAGQTANINEIFDAVPDEKENRPAYIVSFTRTTYGAEPLVKPEAKWIDGRWVRRKGK